MKAASLLLLRTGTGLLCMLWGVIRLGEPSVGPMLANKYYGGLASAQALQSAWGATLVLVGALCVLGLFRKLAYPAQALILVGGALAIWKYLVDPLGLWLLSREESQILFFPSVTLAAATLVLIAFRKEDRFSLDALRKR